MPHCGGSKCKLAWILQVLLHFQIRNDGYENFNNYNTMSSTGLECSYAFTGVWINIFWSCHFLEMKISNESKFQQGISDPECCSNTCSGHSHWNESLTCWNNSDWPPYMSKYLANCIVLVIYTIAFYHDLQKYESNKRTSGDCLNLLEKKKETWICKS